MAKISKRTSKRRRTAGSLDAVVGRLTARVIAAARRSAYEITKAHDGDESNIADENELVEAVEALDRHEGKSPNADISHAGADATDKQ